MSIRKRFRIYKKINKHNKKLDEKIEKNNKRIMKLQKRVFARSDNNNFILIKSRRDKYLLSEWMCIGSVPVGDNGISDSKSRIMKKAAEVLENDKDRC